MAIYIRERAGSSQSKKHFKFNGKIFFILLPGIVLAGLLIVLLLLFETENPVITLGHEPKFLGGRIEMPLEIKDNKSGIRSVRIQLVQEQKVDTLFEQNFPRQAWFSQAGPESLQEKVVIDTRQLGLKEGPAQLRIEARDFSIAGFFGGNLAEKVLPVTVDTTPPKIDLLYTQAAIRPGHTGIMVYRLSEAAAQHGLRIESKKFAGFPLETPNMYVVYFALPWHAKDLQNAAFFAVDEAGNEGMAPCRTVYRKDKDKFDKLSLSDAFLNKKIPEFEQHYPEMTGSRLEKYLYVNNIVRLQNDEAIKKICANPEPHQLWNNRFLRMPGAGRAGFADQRTYTYNGAVVDSQTHLGVDIASVAQAEVRAANRGKVVFADYLGIYGNMVIIDHGQGVFSLYSHLSRITSTTGRMVEQNEAIGNTGTSGMAGGDHLHFAMIIHGIFVTPVEWWDQHWIDVNIKAALGKR